MSNSAKFLQIAGAFAAAAVFAMTSARAGVDTDQVTVTGATGSSATTPAVKVTGDGGVFFSKGVTSSNSATVSSGAGFLWYAPKNALIISDNFASPSPTGVGTNTISIFSASTPTGSKAISIGSGWSGYTATGSNSLLIHRGYATNTESVAINGGTASGFYSTSIGGSSGTASGTYATTIGGGTSSGTYSVVLTSGTSSGIYSVAGALGTASDLYTVGLGYAANASGLFSAAFGYSASASGDYSTAVGDGSSSGKYAFSTNYGTYATGDKSAAFGEYTTAQAYNSFVIGRNNTLGGDPLTWVETDPLFVIGNGTSSAARSDAFVVYKNGQIRIKEPQGDILMGDFD